jgi:hypothetical protein
MMLRIAF